MPLEGFFSILLENTEGRTVRMGLNTLPSPGGCSPSSPKEYDYPLMPGLR